MKWFLPILFILGIGILNKAEGQCKVANLAVQLKSVNNIGGQCQVVFDFSWDQDVNGGNKLAFLHLWRSDQYPALEANNLAYIPTSRYPTNDLLSDALATIVIEKNGTATPQIGTLYYPDPTVPVLSSGLIVVKVPINSTWERMTIKNISLFIPDCTGTGITGDIWASQSEHGQNVHCVSSNVSIIVGNPRVTGLLNCAIPHLYNAQVTNVGDAAITFNYNVYLDEGDGVFEPTTHEIKLTPTSVGPVTLGPGLTYNSGYQPYVPYSGTKPYADQNLWIEVIVQGFPNSAIYLIENTCIPLPVTLSAFTAKRDHADVQLNWETSTEINNSGFAIERQIGSGNFLTIAFVPTKALMGNSEEKLNYGYADINPTKSLSVYRIRQVDIDGQSKFSETRAVRGEGQRQGLLIYPNPSTNGTVYILFEDLNASHDITMINASGKIVKQWNNITAQNMSVSNMPPGVYTLRLVNLTTMEMTYSRFVILNK